MLIKSESEKRLIVKGEIGGKTAYFLIDTGASIGLISEDRKQRYKLLKGREYTGKLIGGSGSSIGTSYICDSIVEIGGKLFNQFVFADISGVRESIRKETGIEILGIVGLPQMKFSGMKIDLRGNGIEI